MENFQVDEPEETVILDQLVPSRKIVGRVVDPDGQPVAGVRIERFFNKEDSRAKTGPTVGFPYVITDDSGYFCLTFPDLPGECLIGISPKGGFKKKLLPESVVARASVIVLEPISEARK